MMYVIIFWLIGLMFLSVMIWAVVGMIEAEVTHKKKMKAILREEKFYNMMAITNLKESK